MYWIDILVFFFGLCWGSFLGLLSYRVPKGLSIVKPFSYCDKCKTPLSVLARIPIVGYFACKAKCPKCNAVIPVRYPIMELVTGLMFLITYQRLMIGTPDQYIPMALRSFALITALVPSIFIDMDERIIPDRFSIGLVIVGFLIALGDSFFCEVPFVSWQRSLIGILVGGGLLFIVAEVYHLITKRDGMGGGDIKLLAGIGAVLGWYPALLVILISSVLGSLFGVFLILFMKKGRLAEIPFGPFIAIAALFYHFISGGGFFI